MVQDRPGTDQVLDRRAQAAIQPAFAGGDDTDGPVLRDTLGRLGHGGSVAEAASQHRDRPASQRQAGAVRRRQHDALACHDGGKGCRRKADLPANRPAWTRQRGADQGGSILGGHRVTVGKGVDDRAPAHRNIHGRTE